MNETVLFFVAVASFAVGYIVGYLIGWYNGRDSLH
jgi:membrane protein DedA with SNARE-associated domain